MPVQRLLELADSSDGMKGRVLWRALPEFADSLEPVENVYSGVPILPQKLLERWSTPKSLSEKVQKVLHH